jgi:hypothetical protein
MTTVLNVHFVFLGAAIGLTGSLVYARDTLRGVTQPNRVTWFMWTLAPLLAAVAEIRQGVGLQWVMTFMVGFGPLLVLTASFISRSGAWKIGPFDIACGVASLCGLIIWALTNNNTVALCAFVAADGLACLPTLAKSWKAPETETALAYGTAWINAVLTLATVSVWTTGTVAFPLWIAFINTIFVSLIAGRIGPRLRGEPRPESLAPAERIISGPRGENHG